MRGEALLKAGRALEAREFFDPLLKEPVVMAARVLCQLVSDLEIVPVNSAEEPAVSRELLGWLRRLERAKATRVISAVQDRVEILRKVLPGAEAALGHRFIHKSQGV